MGPSPPRRPVGRNPGTPAHATANGQRPSPSAAPDSLEVPRLRRSPRPLPSPDCRDRPGRDSSVSAAPPVPASRSLDIEQIVLRGRLILGVLVTAPRNRLRHRGVTGDRRRLGMSVDLLETGAGDNKAWRAQSLARHRDQRAVAGVRDGGRRQSYRRRRGRIDRIGRMARYCPVTAIDLHVSGRSRPNATGLCWPPRPRRQSIDIAVQPTNLLRRGNSSLIVMDVDSIADPGRGDRCSPPAPGARPRSPPSPSPPCAGDGLEASLRGRAALLAGRAGVGLRRGVYDEIEPPRRPHDGADAAAPRLPVCPIVSGGFTRITDRLAEDPASTSRVPTGSRWVDGGSPAGSSGRWSTAPARRPRCASSRPVIGVPEQAVIADRRRRQRPRHVQRGRTGHRHNAKPVPATR